MTVKNQNSMSAFFLKIFISERGEGREKEEERNINGCLPHAPQMGLNLQRRHVPQLGIERA